MNEVVELQRLLAASVANEQHATDRVRSHIVTIELLESALRRREEEIETLKKQRADLIKWIWETIPVDAEVK